MTTGALWCCGSRLSAFRSRCASPAGRWGDRDVPKTRHGPALLRCYLRADLCLRAENNGVDMTTILHLPFPPSVNKATRFNLKTRRTYPDPTKEKFFKQALGMSLIQRGLTPVKGRFTYHLTLNEDYRHGSSDGDNRLKYPLDFAQKIGLIENDKLAEGGSWRWGSCEHGAMLSIHPITE